MTINIKMHKKQQNSNRPLFSFCLFAYNQEKYIREAIEGAFSQTYTPLEIILSDDCSDDNTYDIMKQMAKSYEGPHDVILNRNEVNLGFGEHINRIVNIAKGEWLAFASGDDVSKSDRLSFVFNKLMNTDFHETIKYIGTGVESIDFMGKARRLHYLDFSGEIVLPGCMAVYHSDCFSKFEPLNSNIMVEDFVLPYRALLMGRWLLINEPTVLYRDIASKDYLDSYYKSYKFQTSLILSYKQRNSDIEYIKSDLNDRTIKYLQNLNNMLIERSESVTIKRKQFIDFYTSNWQHKIKSLFINKDFTFYEKIKLLINSSRNFRLAKYYIKSIKDNLKRKKNLEMKESIVLDLIDITDRKYIIQGINSLIPER